MLKIDVTVMTVILLLIAITLISGFLCSVIYNHISQKPPVQQTIIDLLYGDCIIYTYLFTITLSVTLISCLSANEMVLGMPLAIFLADTIYFFISCIALLMTVSSILRLITITTNSEEAGIQLLGPDDKALFIIRIMTIMMTLFSIVFGHFGLKSFPPPFAILVNNEKVIAISRMLKNDPGIFLYFLPPLTAAISNSFAIMVRTFSYVNDCNVNKYCLLLIHIGSRF